MYPWTCDGSATALSKGEQRSTWERLLKRAATEFSEGGQKRLAEDVRAAALEAGSSTAEAVAAGKEAAEHRRKQTKTPCTREHAAGVDLCMMQDLLFCLLSVPRILSNKKMR